MNVERAGEHPVFDFSEKSRFGWTILHMAVYYQFDGLLDMYRADDTSYKHYLLENLDIF